MTEPRPNDEGRRYICERCGGTGMQEAGCWDGTAYAAPAGVCDDCGGSGYLGVIPRRTHAGGGQSQGHGTNG